MVLEWVSLPLVAWAVAPVFIGSVISGQCIDAVQNWYPTLNKPSWCPPAPAFGQIWSLLYVLMGLAAFVVWTEVGFGWPLAAWGINLALNCAWMLIFYKKKDMKLAQLDNLAVLGSAYYVMKVFGRIKPVAGALLYPYVAFLVFANALNLAFIQLNGDAINETGIYESLRDDATKKNPGEAGYDGPNNISAVRPGATPTARNRRVTPESRPLLQPHRNTRFAARPSARPLVTPTMTPLRAML